MRRTWIGPAWVARDANRQPEWSVMLYRTRAGDPLLVIRFGRRAIGLGWFKS